MQVEKLSGNPKPLDILVKINQIIDNMVVSVNGSGADGNGNINIATIPVGAIYVQFAGQSDPTALFGGTWENISSQFAGQFFRAEGGNAAVFGGFQNSGAPNSVTYIGRVEYSTTNPPSALISSIGNKTFSDADFSGESLGFVRADLSKGNAIYGAADEIRPYNSTIRLWKRTE